MTVTAVLLFFLLFLFDVPCVVKQLTGLSCPGCGMSRALISALKLDFASAFYYHPLWVLVLPTFAALVFCGIKKYRRAFLIVGISAAVLVISVWAYRLISGSPVVSFDFQNSAVYRVFCAFSELIRFIFS